MTSFIFGLFSGAIVGGLASFSKNPLSGKPARDDVKDAVNNFTDSVHRVKDIYNEMDEKNQEEGNDQSKAKTFVDALSAASFKTWDHKKIIKQIKTLLGSEDADAEDADAKPEASDESAAKEESEKATETPDLSAATAEESAEETADAASGTSYHH